MKQGSGVWSIGVDGWRKGWVAVSLRDGLFEGAQLFTGFAELIGVFSSAVAIAVDIPIGIPDKEPREADGEARSFIGRSHSSVFPVPSRAALEAPDHASATRLHQSIAGRGLSQQSFALRKKILEVDQLVGADDQIVEVHPEVSFRALAGRPLESSKKSWAGAMKRRTLLNEAGILLPDEIGPAGKAPVDDLLDAAIAAWSAHRYALGEARSLPSNPTLDSRGRLVAIWY